MSWLLKTYPHHSYHPIIRTADFFSSIIKLWLQHRYIFIQFCLLRSNNFNYYTIYYVIFLSVLKSFHNPFTRIRNPSLIIFVLLIIDSQENSHNAVFWWFYSLKSNIITLENTELLQKHSAELGIFQKLSFSDKRHRLYNFFLKHFKIYKKVIYAKH